MAQFNRRPVAADDQAMPGWLGLLTLIGGLAVVCTALYLPREIGKEAEPIVDISGLDLPPVEDILNRVRHPRRMGRTSPAPETPPTSTLDAGLGLADAAPPGDPSQLLSGQQ